MEIDTAKIDDIISRYDKSEESLLAIIQEMQREFNYVPEEGLKRLSEAFDVPESRVYSMGTFYQALSLEPRGKYTIKVCMGTACHLKGAPLILETLERDLYINRGSTTSDKLYTLESVNCVGACAMAPVVVINDDYHGHQSSSKISNVVKKYK